MKKLYCLFAILVALAALAQSAGQFSMTNPSGSLAGCPTPTAGSNILCSVTDGYYASISGAAYVKLGAVAASPTTISCTTASIATGAAGKLTASGCTLQ